MAKVAELLAVAPPPPAGARFALHVTDTELAIWRDRAVNGPYKTLGDVKPNSQGDWDRIVSNKNGVSSTSGIYSRSSPEPANTSNQFFANNTHNINARRGRDAAFWHLVRWPSESTSAAATTAKTWLLNQVAAINWTDRAIWPLGHFGDINPGFQIVMWLGSVVHIYEYLRASEREGYGTIFTASERTSVLTWLYHAADYWQNDPTAEFVAKFSGSSQRELASPSWTSRSNSTQRHAFKFGNGNNHYHYYRHSNNRWAEIVKLVAMVGAILTSEGFTVPTGASPGRTVDFLYNSGYWWLREHLVYTMGPAGHHGDSNRWSSTNAVKAWTYNSATLAAALYCADILARMGDMRAYQFATRSGGGISGNACQTGDPDKSLLWAAEHHMGYVAELHDHYGTDDNGRLNNDYKIKSWQRAAGDERWYNRDFGVGIFNLHFKSDLLRRCIERDPGGGFSDIPGGYRPPTSSSSSGYGNTVDIGLMGEATMFPGVLFQFAHPDRPISQWPNPYPVVV